MKFLIAAFACAGALSLAVAHNIQPKALLFDFNNDATSLDNWAENSDTQYMKGAGASKASLVFLENENGREAVLFALANAVNYVGNANMRIQGSWDLSQYSGIIINCRADIAEGQFNIILRHKGINKSTTNVYKAIFDVTEAVSEFHTIPILLSDFLPQQSSDEALDTSDITSFAISFNADAGEIDAGILEMNWIGVY